MGSRGGNGVMGKNTEYQPATLDDLREMLSKSIGVGLKTIRDLSNRLEKKIESGEIGTYREFNYDDVDCDYLHEYKEIARIVEAGIRNYKLLKSLDAYEEQLPTGRERGKLEYAAKKASE